MLDQILKKNSITIDKNDEELESSDKLVGFGFAAKPVEVVGWGSTPLRMLPTQAF